MVLGLGVGSIEITFIVFVPFRSHDGLDVLYHIPFHALQLRKPNDNGYIPVQRRDKIKKVDTNTLGLEQTDLIKGAWTDEELTQG
jgi:hypothetical protein